MTPPLWHRCLRDADAWLEAAYPEEGCGLVVEDDAGFRFVPCANVAPDRRHHYEVDPAALLRADSTLRAIVHSHPDCRPAFSAADTRGAVLPDGQPAFPGVDFVVVCVRRTGAAEAEVYRFSTLQSRFESIWSRARASA